MYSLGDRIKSYEKVSSPSLLKKVPVMIRVDGRAFHTFTKNCEKPFDKRLMYAMNFAAIDVAKEMQGFKVGYIQSDEVSFILTDYDNLETEGWFDYDLSKIVSISASLMSVYFCRYWEIKEFEVPTYEKNKTYFRFSKLPIFDSRAFNVPIHDVVNALLWRAKDWERNSIQMYARAFFSHKQLINKSCSDMHEMLHSIGKNWATDLSDQEKNRTFIISRDRGIEAVTNILPNYESINSFVGNIFEYQN
jgi:tRNA(His) 5'-end guanylyltransferase